MINYLIWFQKMMQFIKAKTKLRRKVIFFLQFFFLFSFSYCSYEILQTCSSAIFFSFFILLLQLRYFSWREFMTFVQQKNTMRIINWVQNWKNIIIGLFKKNYSFPIDKKMQKAKIFLWFGIFHRLGSPPAEISQSGF